MTKQDLLNGQTFEFDNQEFCEWNGTDHVDAGWIEFSRKLNSFMIFFNGDLIHSVKTFSASEKRLNKLFNKWNLEFTETEI
jgi:hypothetical protein